MTQPDAVMKVCTEGELESHTGSGWQLVRVLSESLFVSEYEMTYDFRLRRRPMDRGPLPPFRDGEDSREKKHRVLVHKYLLRKSIPTRIAELEREKRSVIDAGVKIVDELNQLKHAAKLAEQEVAQAKQETENANAVIDTLQEQLTQEQASKRQMEVDLAAIRQDIGEAAMKRILEGVTR